MRCCNLCKKRNTYGITHWNSDLDWWTNVWWVDTLVSEKLKDLVAVSGLIFLMVMTIQWFFVYFMTVWNGINYGYWGTTVLTNIYGEATFETMAYTITIPLMVYCLYRYLRTFSVKYHPQYNNTKYAKLSRLGNVTFFVTVVMVLLIGVCILILVVLNQ